MFESWGGRLVAVVGLLGILLVLLVGFGTLSPAPGLGAYPTEDDLAANDGADPGDRVQVGGTVKRTGHSHRTGSNADVRERNSIVMEVEYDYYADGARHRGTMNLSVRNVQQPVERGEFLQVYGTLEGERTITAERVIVVPRRNVTYMFVVSFLAGLWVLARLVQGWRIEWATGALRPRDTSEAADSGEADQRHEGVN